MGFCQKWLGHPRRGLRPVLLVLFLSVEKAFSLDLRQEWMTPVDLIKNFW
jgi:hypothetical protein